MNQYNQTNKKREPFDVMLRRFNRDIQLSGILTLAKKKRFFTKDPSRPIRRKSAIRQSQIRHDKRGW